MTSNEKAGGKAGNGSTACTGQGGIKSRKLAARLREAGLRPTRQRLALGKLLFAGGGRHVTAEMLHEEAMQSGVQVSLATIYNSLHQFTQAGLLREVAVEGAKTYFDTNVSRHFHYYNEDTGHLSDIPGDALIIKQLPEPPKGAKITRIDVTVRVSGDGKNDQ